jgi:hypothetical protein
MLKDFIRKIIFIIKEIINVTIKILKDSLSLIGRTILFKEV